MSQKLVLTAKLDQRLVMSQQLRQAITLLQYNTLELKQLVQTQITENPLLELEENEAHEETAEDDSAYPDHYSAHVKSAMKRSPDDEKGLENVAHPTSLRTHLLNQTLLCRFSDEEQCIAEAIIDALDEAGRLTMPLADIALTLGQISVAAVEAVLKIVQTFEPAGIAARDLVECLQIQLQQDANRDQVWQDAWRLLTECSSVDELVHAKRVMKKLGLTFTAYQAALQRLRHYHFAPGLQYSTDQLTPAEPELYVKKSKEGWRVFLADSILTRVHVNRYYHQMLKMHKQNQSNAALQKELQEAQWLIKGLQRRNETLLLVAQFIVEKQHAFFEYGRARMLPMKINDAALALSMHESTISRVTTGKYIATPHGVLELKYFFPSHVMTHDGQAFSATAVKVIIQELVDSEIDHAYSDEEIANILRKKGLNIARRTVAKYREALNIAPSYQRAQRYFIAID